MDEQLTKRMIAWLNKEEHTDDAEIMEGATMLLQLNRNSGLFRTVMTNPKRFVKTVEYELKKFLPMRQRGQTVEQADTEAKALMAELKETVEDDEETDEEAEENEDDEPTSLPAHGGKRLDHDKLPDNIKAIWEENAERWKKIKELYNLCLTFDKPCDRDETVQALKEAWYKYKSEFERYDSCDPNTCVATSDVTFTDIANAKCYLSKALRDDKLVKARAAAMTDDAKEKVIESYRNYLAKVQQRVDLLLKYGETLGEDLRRKLAEGGVSFPAEV